MTTGADHFAEILRQSTLVCADIPQAHRLPFMMQCASGMAVSMAATLYAENAYAEAQDLISLCARMNQEANEQALASDPEAREFATRAIARVAGIPIPEPKISEEAREDREAAMAWAREVLDLAAASPERSIWLHVDDRCCFGGSLEACGKPIDGVQIIASRNVISAVCYCERHGRIMAEAIAQQRATSGAMTSDEIEHMASNATE